MKAIPTMYNGIRFRSRLEAKWACFFDLLGWDWVYEPFDTNGWIPDFQLGERLLIEVKPFRFKYDWCFSDIPPEQAVSFLEKEYYPAENNSINSGYDLLWLGIDGVRRFDYDRAALGAFHSSSISDHPITFNWQSYRSPTITLDDPRQGSFTSLITGKYKSIEEVSYPRFSDISDLWGQAVNSTQWKGRRAS